MHKQVAARWQEFVGCFLAAMLEALFSVCAYLLLLWSAFNRSTEEKELGGAGRTLGIRDGERLTERNGRRGQRRQNGDGEAAGARLLSPGPSSSSETRRRRKRGISKERAADKDAATDIYCERKEGNGRWTG